MPNEIQMRLAENIKQIRKTKKLTQFELAEKADISEAMIKSIETCHSWPSEKTLSQISSALETDVSRFFMPIPLSIPMKTALQTELKATVKEKYCIFLRQVLEELE